MKDNNKGHKDYDNIFRENIEKILFPVIAQELKIDIVKSVPLTDKITRTFSRETDSTFNILTKTGEVFLLHLEFQTVSDKNMLYRMAEYHGLLLKKYQKPIKHVVVYLGKGHSKMKTTLEANKVFSGFTLLNIVDLDLNRLLRSQIPEVIVTAVLGKLGKEKNETLRLIIERLMELAQSKKDLYEYLKQLVFLGRLREIENEIIKIIKDMPITYDITKDSLYQKGIENEKINTEKALEKAAAAAKRAEEESKRAEAASKRAEAASKRAEAASKRAEAASKRAEEESKRAEEESKRAEAASKRAEEEYAKRIHGIKNMLSKGMDVKSIAEIIGETEDFIKEIQAKM